MGNNFSSKGWEILTEGRYFRDGRSGKNGKNGNNVGMGMKGYC